MGKINVLSFEVANLIAAGEVVDRPASAIKEMMENAIDAGASRITVEIQNGGVTFMRVSDNGHGMPPEDLPMAIRRHATSKISEAQDLDGIATLGFRGEALAAIAAVSRLRILSKTPDAALGAQMDVDCGEIVDITERGCAVGTTVIAEDLFANVPARRKFLKRDVTEAMAVTANVEKLALSHPEIAFCLIVDGNVKLETAGDRSLKSAIWSVFGKDFASRLIEVNGDFDGITVKGYVGRPDSVRPNRNYQNFFINSRYIKSKTASAALEQAFTSYCAPEKFPCCVLFIGLNPMRVDVNVHPAKLEVKFTNEKPVFESVYYAVRQALEQNTARPELQIPKQKPSVSDAFTSVERGESLGKRQLSIDTPPAPAKQENKWEHLTAQQYVEQYIQGKKPEKNAGQEKAAAAAPAPAQPPKVPATRIPEAPPEPKTPVIPQTSPKEENPPQPKTPHIQQSPQIPEQAHTPLPVQPEKEPVPTAEKGMYRLAGQVFNAYLIVEIGERMLLIDQHAAHERILFEQLKANMKRKEAASQLLMLPIEVMMTSGEVQTLGDFRAELEAVGFSFSTGRFTVTVDAIPVGLESEAVAQMLPVIAERLQSGTGNAALTRDIVFEKALYQGACKAAIKAGRVYPPEHLVWLTDQLMALPDITYCPHGRPVAMEMSKKNLDRQFERS
ncbi:MAG: DNA mismatch repair endonuclease MutL [Ruminococcaceae bacterium]|nr:DNA mismatch repair endonuclease MutL [Oscillospiraceae bacterium]